MTYLLTAMKFNIQYFDFRPLQLPSVCIATAARDIVATATLLGSINVSQFMRILKMRSADDKHTNSKAPRSTK